MGNIFITNDVISNQNLFKQAQPVPTGTPPVALNQGALPNAQLPQNVVELSKFFMALHVPETEINMGTLIKEQTLAANLIREKLLSVFPNLANVMDSNDLIKLITAAVYQWANTYVPKTPVKA